MPGRGYHAPGYALEGYVVGDFDISQEVQLLSLTAVIEMHELDATAIGGGQLLFFNGTNELRHPLVWQGADYRPIWIKAQGFDMGTGGQLPRPNIQVANVDGVVAALLNSLDDLIGAKWIRRRTHARFLDVENFAGGNPNANPNVHYPDDIFTVERKVREDKDIIEFELSAAVDLQGLVIPKRPMIANTCTWVYRGEGCGYGGAAVAEADDTPTADLSLDDCSHTINGCGMRFGATKALPYGGFPSAGAVQ